MALPDEAIISLSPGDAKTSRHAANEHDGSEWENHFPRYRPTNPRRRNT